MRKNLFISLILLFTVACSDSDTSTDVSDETIVGENTFVSEDGSTLTVNFSGQPTQGESYIVEYTLLSADGTPVSGTIHWGDNSDDRIAGIGEIAHVYLETGFESINVVLDDGTLFRLVDVIVQPGEAEESSSSATTSTVSPSVTPVLSIPSCNADFVISGGSGVGNLQFNSLSGQIGSTSPTAILSGIQVNVIARITSGNGQVAFTPLASVTTSAGGSFSSTNPTQFTIPFADPISVQTFFSFNLFSVFNFDASISLCDSTDTDLGAPVIIGTVTN